MEFKKLLFLLLLCTQSVQARYHAIKDENQFFDALNHYEFVIACFLPETDMKDYDFKKNIHALQNVMRTISQTDPYKRMLKNEIGFFVIDMTKDSLQQIAKKYVTHSKNTVNIVVLQDGKLVIDASDNKAVLKGFATKKDILDFMTKYCGEKIDELLADKYEQQEHEHNVISDRYQASKLARYPYGGYAPYNPWGSPGTYIYTGYAQFYPYGYGYNGYDFFIP